MSDTPERPERPPAAAAAARKVFLSFLCANVVLAVFFGSVALLSSRSIFVWVGYTGCGLALLLVPVFGWAWFKAGKPFATDAATSAGPKDRSTS